MKKKQSISLFRASLLNVMKKIVLKIVSVFPAQYGITDFTSVWLTEISSHSFIPNMPMQLHSFIFAVTSVAAIFLTIYLFIFFEIYGIIYSILFCQGVNKSAETISFLLQTA